jgi:hypothetical protein
MRLAAVTGRHRSTIWKVLRRHGLSRRPGPGRQTHKRFEWAQAGALLHIDAFSVQRFGRPGHWATGDRADRNRGQARASSSVCSTTTAALSTASCTPPRPPRRPRRPSCAAPHGCASRPGRA